jgi:ferredoxin
MAEPTPKEMARIIHRPPSAGWMDTKAKIREGMYCYPAKLSSIEGVDMPNPHEWNPLEDDWNLPDNWQEIIHNGMRERLDKFRSFKVFMDICVRCGACADKCHFSSAPATPKTCRFYAVN